MLKRPEQRKGRRGPARGAPRAGRLYLDYAAATPLDPRVERAMAPHWGDVFGNPSALHAEGVAAKHALEGARERVAWLLHAHAPEIVFTGSGTEANNLAILGFFAALERAGKKLRDLHAVTSAVEHESVRAPFAELARRGLNLTIIAPDASGLVPAERVLSAISGRTALVSLQAANHELGVLQPIAEVGKKIRALRRDVRALPQFHTDAAQAALYENCAVDRLMADLVVLDAQKLYGPKGVGALYVRQGIKLAPIILGGGQERGLRSGTESVPLAVGFAEALALAFARRERERARLRSLRELFLRLITKRVPQAVLNGATDPRRTLPNIVNLSLPARDGEMLSLLLDARGIAVTTKSACAEGERRSAVVFATTGDEARASSTLRFSFGVGTAARDIRRAAAALADIVTPR